MEKSKKGTYVSLFEHVNENSIEQTQIDTNANNQEQSIKFKNYIIIYRNNKQKC